MPSAGAPPPPTIAEAGEAIAMRAMVRRQRESFGDVSQFAKRLSTRALPVPWRGRVDTRETQCRGGATVPILARVPGGTVSPPRLALRFAHASRPSPSRGGYRKDTPMSAILLTPPAAEPWTVAEAKAFLRVEHDDDDAIIASLIAAARGQIEALTRRALMTQTLALRAGSMAGGWPVEPAHGAAAQRDRGAGV